MTPRILVVALALSAAVITAQERSRPQERDRSEKPEEYSPLGFYGLRALEQAYPEEVGSARVVQASGEKYWAFRGAAFRGGANAGAVWSSLGPETNIQDPTTQSSQNVSGRVAALAISPTCTVNGACRVWVATAGGGVWRSDDAMHPEDPRWRWMSQGLGTNNTGSLGLDPNDATGNTIYVGTGEPNSPNNSGAGTGVYKSVNGGDSWTRLSTMILDPAVSPSPIDFTYTRAISAVVIPRGSPQTIYVATTTAILGMTAVRGGQVQSNGLPQPRPALYKTENGGSSWTIAWVPPLDPVIVANPNLNPGVVDTIIGVRDVKIDPREPRTVYATAFNNAIHRSAPSLENGDASFKPVFALVGPAFFRDLAMFDVTVANGHVRIYAYNGTEALAPQSLYRLDNADVPASSLVSGSGRNLSNTGAWQKMSSDDLTSPRSISRRMCTSQCFYDLVVATPAGQPDTVVIGGVASPVTGDATLRSTDAGETFQSFGDDAQSPRQSSHVDVRAVAFHPRNPRIAFVGSDGGVVRNDGTFTNLTTRCGQDFPTSATCNTFLREVPTRIYFLNKGLQTLQFFNISVDPRAPLTRMIGGLQDNSTIWLDGSGLGNGRVWKSLFPFGDGTSASGFHPSRSNVLFASFQSNNFYTNFRNGDRSRWVRTGDPIRAAAERDTITGSTGRQFITFDSVNPDTQFTGFQHVWRTKNNGGDQAFLEASCTGLTPAPTNCGDWVPLGVSFPFPAGTTAASPSRFPGDLTSTFYGSDRGGGLIVAVERGAGDANTLWAATSFGRLFVSKNGDAAGAAVTFSRIDTPAMPNRFVTRIVVDRADPNVALIAYSGFNAITPNTPGHIFRATYRPNSGTATFELLDADLGDLPINTLAFDDARGDLYAGTDFGPLLLRKNSSVWEIAGIGFPEALMVDLELISEQRLLVAATHGLGIFVLRLPQ